MTRLLMTLAIVVGGTVQQPVFRARTDLVRSDVLVTDDGVPVTGLTAIDFEVLDNGVRQRVTAAGATTDLLRQLTHEDRFAIVAFGDQVSRLTTAGASVADASNSPGVTGVTPLRRR